MIGKVGSATDEPGAAYQGRQTTGRIRQINLFRIGFSVWNCLLQPCLVGKCGEKQYKVRGLYFLCLAELFQAFFNVPESHRLD